ncbi:MAG: DUF1028 domain-containing protein [Burkholderiales bacterium]
MTFAIAGRCARTGRLGVAISTNPIGVGARCPFIAPHAGIVVTMARTDPRLGPFGLNLLRQGHAAPAVLAQIAASDPGIEHRQVCVIDRDGHSAARTGAHNKVWSGAVTQKNLVSMGNYLTSPKTADAMAESWAKTDSLDLDERLLLALEAGRDAGGQVGGQHSAGLLVYDWDVHAYVDLRVDYHDEPIGELRRIYDVHRPLIPYYYGRPGNPDEFGREEEYLARQGKPYALKGK